MAINFGALILPIIFLVVVELSSVAREISLEDAIVNEYPPIFFRGEGFGFVPRLGRFNFIHGINTTVILFGVLLLSGGTLELALVSALLLFVLWVALPMLEVEEYDDILGAGVTVNSIYWHMGSGIIAIPYAVIYERFLEDWQYLGIEWFDALLVIIFFSAVWALLISLDSELEAVYGAD